MLNLLRAAFWISVVAYFMPDSPGMEAIFGTVRQNAAQAATATTSPDAYAEVRRICMHDPKLCIAAVHAFGAATPRAVQGLDVLAAVLDEAKREASY